MLSGWHLELAKWLTTVIVYRLPFHCRIRDLRPEITWTYFSWVSKVFPFSICFLVFETSVIIHLCNRSRLSTPDPTRFEAIKPLDAWKTEFLVKVQRCWELWLYGCIMGVKMGSLFGQGYNWLFPTWIIWQVVWEPYGRGRYGFKLIKLIASPGGWWNLCDISLDSLENWMSMFRFDVHLSPSPLSTDSGQR